MVYFTSSDFEELGKRNHCNKDRQFQEFMSKVGVSLTLFRFKLNPYISFSLCIKQLSSYYISLWCRSWWLYHQRKWNLKKLSSLPSSCTNTKSRATNSMQHRFLIFFIAHCMLRDFFLFFIVVRCILSFNSIISIIIFLLCLYVYHKCRVIFLFYVFISFIIYKHCPLNQHLSLSSLIRCSPFSFWLQTDCKWFSILVYNFLNNLWYITSGSADL